MESLLVSLHHHQIVQLVGTFEIAFGFTHASSASYDFDKLVHFSKNCYSRITLFCHC